MPRRAVSFAPVIAAVATVCVAVGAVAVARGQLRGDNPGLAALTLVAGASFVAAGLLARARRPERWTGALMIAAGFALFAGALIEANSSLPFTIGLAVSAVPVAVVAHLLLAFPEGRLHSTLERAVVVTAYFNAIVVEIVMLMFMGIEHVGGCPCPRNLLFITDDMTVHSALMDAERLIGIAVAVVVALLLILRFWRASPILRRALAPVILTGGLTSVLLGALLVANQWSVAVSRDLQSAERLALATIPLAYLVRLFRSRLARGGVSDLVVELGRSPDEHGGLEDALARALRDPTVRLGYWMPESGDYIDVDGARVDATPTADRAVTVLERRGERVAVLVHDAALREDPTLLEAVSSAAGLALENERLLAELRSQLEQIRESRARIVDAGDAERRRLERNLHDGAQQRLVSVSLQIGRVATKLDDPTEAAALLDDIRSELGLALEELRELARGIHPALLTDRGLAVALNALAARAPIPVRVAVDLPSRLPPQLEAAVYYVVAEALTNTAKYARASEAVVEVECTEEALHVVVADDGIGGADLGAGTGLRGLRDRVEAFAGRIEVTSEPGAGTQIVVELPL